MLIHGSDQALRFRWVQSGRANSLPLISFGQCLCHNTSFSKIKLRARGVVLFCDDVFLVVAILFVFNGFYLFLLV